MIPQETIEQIRQSSDIGQVVGEFVRLRRRGRNFEALCPFHEEKTPSFKVNVDKQIYHCFGCGKGGNVFTFLMEHERMSFIEAVRLLARKANIQIRETVTDVQREQLEKLNFAQQVAVEYFQSVLKRPQYRTVSEGYLKQRRGLTDETIGFFQLGLADDSWDALVNYAQKKGIGGEDLVAAGLASKTEKAGRYVDRFRERLMIPIFNLSNKPIAFGGRTLKKGENVKYINSPETKLYSKSNVLYGLNFSRDTIRAQNSVLVVEGYFDFISLWQAGVRNVVASSGTAFTAQQARLIARFAEQVFLFFDADSAGQAAALRSIDVLYDAGLEVHVMRPPAGMDPDNVARELGREKVEELQAAALRYIPYRLQGINVNETGIIGREKLIKELSALAAKIADPTRRAVFLEEAATLLKVDRTLLRGDAGTTRQTPTAANPRKFDKLEFEFLSLLCSNPPHLEFVFEQVSPDDFDSKKLARLYSAMITQYRNLGGLNPHRLYETFEDDEMHQMVTQLAVAEWDPAMIEAEVRERTQDFLVRRQKKIRNRLQKELAQAEADGNSERANELLAQLKAYGL